MCDRTPCALGSASGATNSANSSRRHILKTVVPAAKDGTDDSWNVVAVHNGRIYGAQAAAPPIVELLNRICAGSTAG
jgi:hypothetical protein